MKKLRPHSQRRALLPQGEGKRALTNVGGASERHGDEALSQTLANVLAVRAGERDATRTHIFHAYPARMHPEIARRLVLTTADGASVLDPFCGSGTVLIESVALGRKTLGRDLSPFAVELAQLKCRATTNAERKRIVTAAHAVATEAEKIVHDGRELPIPAGEERWFFRHTLAELAALMDRIRTRTDPLELLALRMLFSSILIKLSLQRSDSDIRVDDVKDVPRGAAPRWFAKKSFELAHALAAFSRGIPEGTLAADVRVDDATKLTTVEANSIDAIITSPPYAANYDYAAHHARRYAWLSLDAKTFSRDEMGAARWFKDDPASGASRFDRELAEMCGSFARVMAPNATAYVLIADGAADGMILRADTSLASAANSAGLSVAARASQRRDAFQEDAQRAFAVRPRREHLIALRRSL